MASGLGQHSAVATPEYLTIQSNASDIINSLGAQVDPGLFAQKLSEVGIVSAYVVQKASAHNVLTDNRIQDVVQAVLAQIKLDPSKYQNFINVLRDDYPLLAEKLTACYELLTCPDDPKSSQQSLAGSCDQLAGRTSSNEAVEPTGERDVHPQPVAIPARVALRRLSDAESWDLSGKFAAMLSKLIPLMEKALSLETFKQFLRQFCDVRTGQPYIEPAVYQRCTSTGEILNALLQHNRFHPIQLSLLNMIVDKYGCDECKRLLRDYESEIPKAAPLKRSHNELRDEEIDSSFSAKRLKVKITGEPDTCSLNVVERTKAALVRTSGVDGSAVVFGNHTPGSVVLNFIIPVCTIKSFIDVSQNEEKLSILAAVGIMLISVDHIVIHVRPQTVGYLASRPDLSPFEHQTSASMEKVLCESIQGGAEIKQDPTHTVSDIERHTEPVEKEYDHEPMDWYECSQDELGKIGAMVNSVVNIMKKAETNQPGIVETLTKAVTGLTTEEARTDTGEVHDRSTVIIKACNEIKADIMRLKPKFQSLVDRNQAILNDQTRLITIIQGIAASYMQKVKQLPRLVSMSADTQLTATAAALENAISSEINAKVVGHLSNLHQNKDRATVRSRICGIKTVITQPSVNEMQKSWSSAMTITRDVQTKQVSVILSQLKTELIVELSKQVATKGTDLAVVVSLGKVVISQITQQFGQLNPITFLPVVPTLHLPLSTDSIADASLEAHITAGTITEYHQEERVWKGSRKYAGIVGPRKKHRYMESVPYQVQVYSPNISSILATFTALASQWRRQFNEKLAEAVTRSLIHVSQQAEAAINTALARPRQAIEEALAEDEEAVESIQTKVNVLMSYWRELERIENECKQELIT